VSKPKFRIDVKIAEILREAGVPWHLENGHDHVRLFVGGRQVQVLPRGRGKSSKTGFAARNAIANVRRAIREYRAWKYHNFKPHPVACVGHRSGAFGMKSGDVVVYSIDGRECRADEFLHDGDAFVTWADGTHGTVHWNHLRPTGENKCT
jgi:hypothetical protein